MRLEGSSEAVELMKKLRDNDQKKVIVRVQRKAARPVVRAAKSNVSAHSNTVQRSVKAFLPRGARNRANPILFVGPRRSNNPDADPWYAHIVEGGAKGKGRFAKGGSYGARSEGARAKKNEIFRFMNRSREGIQKYRADQQPRPFMKPAVDQNMQKVQQIMITDMSQHIASEIKKLK